MVEADLSILARLIDARRQVSARRLVAPGPGARQLQGLFEAAAGAADHGRIRPWRLVMIPDAARPDLADAFSAALLDRDPNATDEQQREARAKAAHAPVLLLAILRLQDEDASLPRIPAAERLVALGGALHLLLLAARAQGFDGGLASGRAMNSRALHDLFGLADGEQAVCFVALGTVSDRRAAAARPVPADFVKVLCPASRGAGAVTTTWAAPSCR